MRRFLPWSEDLGSPQHGLHGSPPVPEGPGVRPHGCDDLRRDPKDPVSSAACARLRPCPKAWVSKSTVAQAFSQTRGLGVPPAQMYCLPPLSEDAGFVQHGGCTGLLRRPKAPFSSRTVVLVRLMRVRLLPPLSEDAGFQWRGSPIASRVRRPKTWPAVRTLPPLSEDRGFHLRGCVFLFPCPKARGRIDAVHGTPPLPESMGFSPRGALPCCLPEQATDGPWPKPGAGESFHPQEAAEAASSRFLPLPEGAGFRQTGMAL